MIQKFPISRDDRLYHAWPDVALTATGRLVCVFSECTHHGDRSYTRVMLTTSEDRGRSWTPKRPLTEPLSGDPAENEYWNCARISTLSDGRLAVAVDRLLGKELSRRRTRNLLYFSDDEGESFSGPVETPAEGIVPDQVIELREGENAGRWLIGAHEVTNGDTDQATWQQRTWFSDDRGATWSPPVLAASEPGLQLCEGSLVELPGGVLVVFMRENSNLGRDAYKAVSRDGGQSWGPATRFPLPGCHRPVAGVLASGRVMITHRYNPGGRPKWGRWQNTFAALADVDSCLAGQRNDASVRILPLDYDRHVESDCGYTGWVQFEDGEIYVVNYLLDDHPRGQIRGYAFGEDEFLLGA